MASTEWVLSDDWKLWRDAQWGSRMNPFRVLRSAAFNTLPWEKLFAPFERFSCRSVICTRGVAIVAGEVVSKQIEKWCILRCCCFSLLRKRVLFCWGNLQRLFIDVWFLTSLTCLAESKWNLIWNCFCTTTLYGLKLSSRCTSKKKNSQSGMSEYFLDLTADENTGITESGQNCLRVSTLGECSSKFLPSESVLK